MSNNNISYTPPGRLGDPGLNVITDPRTHPKVREALLGLGISGLPTPELPATFSIENLTPLIKETDEMTTALYESLDNELPSDASESEVEVTTQTIKGVDNNDILLYIYKPASTTGPLPAVIYYHGGGMVFIPTDTKPHRRWLRSLALQGLIAIGVDFRNAYDAATGGHNPFPAGLNDCAAAAQHIASHRGELGISKLILQGESGGGNLSLATALKAKREGWIDEIAGVYGLVPYISNGYHWPRERMLRELPSLVENDGYMVRMATSAAFAYFYGPEAMEDARAWPYHASVEEVKGLPPVVLRMDELDPLRDEGVVFARKLAEAGVRVEAKIGLGTIHGSALVLRKALPEVHEAVVGEIAAFAKGL